jgi:superfamily II DNA/RNA helicase
LTSSPTFADLGITDSLTGILAVAGITCPTAVQRRVIPPILTGTSLLFQSETGTGKTLAYLLPLLERLSHVDGPAPGPAFLVAAPTHELCSQIKQEVQRLTSPADKTVLCIGGSPMQRQIEALRPGRGERIVAAVGNPGRLSELIALRRLKTAALSAVILDEADRLFARDQADETAALLALLPPGVQLIGCSATIDQKVTRAIAAVTGAAPELVTLPLEDVLRRHIEHQALFAEERDKFDTLRRYLAAVKPAKALVFMSRAQDVATVVSKLAAKGVPCAGLYAGLDKQERRRTIDRFRSGAIPLLVTSDLAARGLDIPGITQVVQLDLPLTPEGFVHRAGRTARTGPQGVAAGVNLVIGTEWELRRYAQLEKHLGLVVHPKVLYQGRLLAPEEEAAEAGEAAVTP